jgi:2-polyprenyl-3-methyl-5-hydroxy-6-metoxy-1,4-benzoquinol methylase
MKRFDCVLQRWRIRRAAKYLPSDLRLIDVGAYRGELFEYLGNRLVAGFGVEPLLENRRQAPRYVIEKGHFPAVRPRESGWDAITLLAVLEHIPPAQQGAVAEACHALLRSGGRVVVTVPSRAVDGILAVLKRLRVIDGMSLEEHHGFDPSATERIFAWPRFRLLRHSRFQFGLNHLYVFEAQPDQPPGPPRIAATTDSR